MVSAFITTLSALTGSVIGGLTSTGTTWIAQRAHARSGRLVQETARREDLYRDFIVVASKAYGDALVSSEPDIPELVTLYSLIGQMRVVSASQTIECADKIILTIIDTYFAPNRSVRELRDMIKLGVGIDPLKDFAEAAREEIRKLKFK